MSKIIASILFSENAKIDCLNQVHKSRRPPFLNLNRIIVNTTHLLILASFFSFQVIDFGSSCYEHQRVYTYIQSRFYRAPEVILGARYGMPIDMWSLGCILAELLTGYPLLPGEDEGDQLSCIIELLGMPPQKLLDQSKRAKNFISSKGKFYHPSTPTASSSLASYSLAS